VAFFGNGGSPDLEFVTTAVDGSGNDVYACPGDPSRNGYTFNGWDTAMNGGGNLVVDGQPAIHGNIAYAQWKPVPGEQDLFISSIDVDAGTGDVTLTWNDAQITIAAPYTLFIHAANGLTQPNWITFEGDDVPPGVKDFLVISLGGGDFSTTLDAALLNLNPQQMFFKLQAVPE
jgi:uncharacterized repeat protein (TIGR02543 family)